MTPEPDCGWGTSRRRPGTGGAGGERHGNEETGRARNAGLGRGGGCGWDGGDERDDNPREQDATAAVAGDGIVVGEETAARPVRQREMVDLWWLTGTQTPTHLFQCRAPPAKSRQFFAVPRVVMTEKATIYCFFNERQRYAYDQ